MSSTVALLPNAHYPKQRNGADGCPTHAVGHPFPRRLSRACERVLPPLLSLSPDGSGGLFFCEA